ncbi:MAG: type IV toxin-antitoxin system AbiEi family antitoxin domain-containing protein [Bryobacteraceae bacterium]
MNSHNRRKLNWLHRNLSEGLVADAGWFERHGISRQLRRKYVLSGWLLSLARGVYTRPVPYESKRRLPWQQLAISLGSLLDVPVAVGGRTALELHGFSHYLAANGPREVQLYAKHDLPRWVWRVPVSAPLVVHKTTRLFTKAGTIPSAAAAASATDMLARSGLAHQPWGHAGWTLTVSTPERAMLELLDELPNRETFHQADVLMEGLRNLSPRRLQALLVDCKSVKVKRLFFWFAERHGHAWLRRLDRSKIDLGKGKRMLVRGGKLDSKYDITVPKNFHGVR